MLKQSFSGPKLHHKQIAKPTTEAIWKRRLPSLFWNSNFLREIPYIVFPFDKDTLNLEAGTLCNNTELGPLGVGHWWWIGGTVNQKFGAVSNVVVIVVALLLLLHLLLVLAPVLVLVVRSDMARLRGSMPYINLWSYHQVAPVSKQDLGNHNIVVQDSRLQWQCHSCYCNIFFGGFVGGLPKNILVKHVEIYWDRHGRVAYHCHDVHWNDPTNTVPTWLPPRREFGRNHADVKQKLEKKFSEACLRRKERGMRLRMGKHVEDYIRVNNWREPAGEWVQGSQTDIWHEHWRQSTSLWGKE